MEVLVILKDVLGSVTKGIFYDYSFRSNHLITYRNIKFRSFLDSPKYFYILENYRD